MSGSKIKSKHWLLTDVMSGLEYLEPVIGVRVCGNVNSVKSETQLAGAGAQVLCAGSKSGRAQHQRRERGGDLPPPAQAEQRESRGVLLLLLNCLSRIFIVV